MAPRPFRDPWLWLHSLGRPDDYTRERVNRGGHLVPIARRQRRQRRKRYVVSRKAMQCRLPSGVIKHGWKIPELNGGWENHL